MKPEIPDDPDWDVVVIGGALAGSSTALQLLRAKPGLRILILEKSTRFSRRVGEATVEISAFFLGRVLGLTRHLNEAHLVKQGMRFWFTNETASTLKECGEIGGRYQVRLPAYQLDRAVIDEEVIRLAQDAGAKVLRGSYYGMQALLVLYMTKELLLPGHIENIAFFSSFRRLFGNLEGQALASAIFGTYAASVYLTPILGGLLADRVLGKKRAVLIGGLSMAAGHFLMAFEVSFLIALLCLIIGSGLMKGNIASLVGSLYKPEDLRRADAFQICA